MYLGKDRAKAFPESVIKRLQRFFMDMRVGPGGCVNECARRMRLYGRVLPDTPRLPDPLAYIKNIEIHTLGVSLQKLQHVVKHIIVQLFSLYEKRVACAVHLYKLLVHGIWE